MSDARAQNRFTQIAPVRSLSTGSAALTRASVPSILIKILNADAVWCPATQLVEMTESMTKLRKTGRAVDMARVAVIGGGFGGIAAGVELKKAGLGNFTIFEKSDGAGGTWWENRYPGAEVDTPSHLYSFSYAPWKWSRTHAQQPELQEYTQHVVDKFDLREHFLYNTRITSVEWNSDKHTYLVRHDSGLEETFDYVISAVGFLNEPAIPNLPGAETFKGLAFHSSHWPVGLDVSGLRVGVVGTGSTAVQLVSETSKLADNVTVFQRSPNWVIPKNDRDLSVSEQEQLSWSLRRKIHRFKLFLQSESGRVGARQARAGSTRNIREQKTARDHLHRVLRSRPDLIEVMEPDYEFAGKRPVINDTFYPALLKENVELVPRSVQGFTEAGVVDSSGRLHELDVVIYATGFKAAQYLNRLHVGRGDNSSLKDHWQGDPSAFLGITVSGFPNFFMLYGPNTNAGPVIFFLEKQAQFAVKSIKQTIESGHSSVDTKLRWHSIYNRRVQARLQKTVWATTENYYKSASGRIVTQWPSTATLYWILCVMLRRPSSVYSQLPE